MVNQVYGGGKYALFLFVLMTGLGGRFHRLIFFEEVTDVRGTHRIRPRL